MKLAVLGSNGFVGSNLTQYLKYNYDVVPVTRQTVDLLDPLKVKEYLKINNFDVIVNCAATMTDNNLLNDARNNLGIFMNFYNNLDLFGKFINTASGAEFDRSKNIDNMNETSIFNCMPKDSYGWSQNIKARLCATTPNFYNLRIFNCFGLTEPKTRIFPKFVNSDQFTIYDDRYFDYFSVQDLCIVVEYFLKQEPKFKDINCVYNTKYFISEVISMFKIINNINKTINVVSKSNLNYTGSSLRIDSLNLPLRGLEYGLANYFTATKI